MNNYTYRYTTTDRHGLELCLSEILASDGPQCPALIIPKGRKGWEVRVPRLTMLRAQTPAQWEKVGHATYIDLICDVEAAMEELPEEITELLPDDIDLLDYLFGLLRKGIQRTPEIFLEDGEKEALERHSTPNHTR